MCNILKLGLIHEVMLIRKDITKPQLRRDLNFVTGTMSKFNKNKKCGIVRFIGQQV